MLDGAGAFFGESRVDYLVLLVHEHSQFGGGSRLIELEGLWLSRVFRFLKVLHLSDERLLQFAEVRYRPGAARLERKLKAALARPLSRVEVFFLSFLLFVDVGLHSWGQFRIFGGLLSVASDALLSFVFITFHHHSKPRYEDAPRNISCSELVQHGLVNVLHVVRTVSSLLSVPLVKTKWLRQCFIFC